LAKRVWKAIKELGYYPNRQARALVSGQSRVFGLIVSEITNPFFLEIVESFETLAVEQNYEILLTSTIHDSQAHGTCRPQDDWRKYMSATGGMKTAFELRIEVPAELSIVGFDGIRMATRWSIPGAAQIVDLWIC
jgi:DNA-binding LacI/PurR family transcriptional regulator